MTAAVSLDEFRKDSLEQEEFQDFQMDSDGAVICGSEEVDPNYFEQFLWDATVYAITCVEAFFKGKEMYCGGPVRQRTLRSPKYLSAVLNTDVIGGVDRAFACMQRSGHPVSKKRSTITTVPSDTKFVISIMKHCKSLGIPKCFAPGIMLMYLEICEGVTVFGRS